MDPLETMRDARASGRFNAKIDESAFRRASASTGSEAAAGGNTVPSMPPRPVSQNYRKTLVGGDQGVRASTEIGQPQGELEMEPVLAVMATPYIPGINAPAGQRISKGQRTSMGQSTPNTNRTSIGNRASVGNRTSVGRQNRMSLGEASRVSAAIAPGGSLEGQVDLLADCPSPDNPRPKSMLRHASSYAAWRVNMVKKKKCGLGATTVPCFSVTILVMCCAVMIIEIAYNGWRLEPFNLNPTLGPSTEVLVQLGAKRADFIVVDGEWWRLFTPMMLHAGILHLFFNMLGLVNIGMPLEKDYGSLSIAYIYITSGVIGVLVSCIFVPKLLGVGASGAIFGLFGAAWADLVQNWSLYKGEGYAKKMLFQLSVITTINILVGMMPYLDNFAHLGGMFAGFQTGLTTLIQDRYTRYGEKKDRKPYQVVLQVISFISTPIAILVMLSMLYLQMDASKICSWCKYLSCLPMPPGAQPGQGWWDCDACASSDVGVSQPFNNRTVEIDCPESIAVVYKTIPEGIDTITYNDIAAYCRELCPGQQLGGS